MSIISNNLAEQFRLVETEIIRNKMELLEIKNKLDNMSFCVMMCSLDVYIRRINELERILEEIR